jgi:hypothetical protein
MDVRSVLELFYFVSGVVTAVAVTVGLLQLRLLKRDYAMRVDRAAKERAIDTVERYVAKFIPLANANTTELRAAKLSRYSGPIGDFSPASVPAEYQNLTAQRALHYSCITALNELEYITAVFTSGVADEELGFRIIGRSFIFSVQSYYDLIALLRDDKAHKPWSNIVQLYGVWSSRLTAAELAAIGEETAAKLAGIQVTRISPIGQ